MFAYKEEEIKALLKLSVHIISERRKINTHDLTVKALKTGECISCLAVWK